MVTSFFNPSTHEAEAEGVLRICLMVLFVCLFVFVFHNRVSLRSPGCPQTHSVDQAGLKLRNRPASASQVLGLKARTITAQHILRG